MYLSTRTPRGLFADVRTTPWSAFGHDLSLTGAASIGQMFVRDIVNRMTTAAPMCSRRCA